MSGKLVRDRIPEIIEKNEGEKPKVAVLQKFSSCDAVLRNKLVEEANEIRGAENRESLVEEIADLEEAKRALMRLHGISDDELEKMRAAKLNARGGFEKFLFLPGE